MMEGKQGQSDRKTAKKSAKKPKKQLRPQWTEGEKEKMLDCIEGNPVLDENLTEQKNAAWKEMAAAINVVGGHNRTYSECRAKKTKWFSKIKNKFAENRRFYQQTGNGGEPPNYFNKIDERVCRMIPKVKIEGIEGAPKTEWPMNDNHPGKRPFTGLTTDDLLACIAENTGTVGKIEQETQDPNLSPNLSIADPNLSIADPNLSIADPNLSSADVLMDEGVETRSTHDSQNCFNGIERRLGDIDENIVDVRREINLLVCAQEQQRSTLELMADMLGTISTTVGILNVAMTPTPACASGAGVEPTDYAAMAVSIKDEIYKHALTLNVEVDPTRQPLREVRVTKDRQALGGCEVHVTKNRQE